MSTTSPVLNCLRLVVTLTVETAKSDIRIVASAS